MRTLLFLTYHFPPMAAVGVQRAVKFVRHLPGCGWRPTVITAGGIGSYDEDPSLLADVPADVRVERTFPLTSSHAAAWPAKVGLESLARFVDELLRAPDRHAPGIAAVVARGLSVARRSPVDALWSTSPPESTHVAGLILSLRTGLPWIADFRNEWTTHPEAGRPLTPFHGALRRALEAAVLRRADQVVALNPPHAELLRSAWPRRAGDIHVIENGVDPGDLAGLDEVAPPTDRFLLTYAGGISDPDPLRICLRAAQERIAAGEIDPARFEFRLTGYLWQAERMLREAPAWVRCPGVVPYREALRLCRGSTALLLAQGKVRERVYPSKLYDYLAVGRPILAALSPGSACRVRLAAGGRAVFADPTDPRSVGEALAGLFRRWREGGLSPGPLPATEPECDRREQAAKLARLLDEAVRARGGRGSGGDRHR